MMALDGSALGRQQATIRLRVRILPPNPTTAVGTAPTIGPRQCSRELTRAHHLIHTAGLSRGLCRSLRQSYVSVQRPKCTVAADTAAATTLLAASRRPSPSVVEAAVLTVEAGAAIAVAVVAAEPTLI